MKATDCLHEFIFEDKIWTNIQHRNGRTSLLNVAFSLGVLSHLYKDIILKIGVAADAKVDI